MQNQVQQLILNKLKNLVTDNTEITPKPTESIDNKTTHQTSQIMSISIRGWITLIVVLTVCAMSVMKIDIKEPLYTMTGMIIAFYFGQNKSTGSGTLPPTK